MATGPSSEPNDGKESDMTTDRSIYEEETMSGQDDLYPFDQLKGEQLDPVSIPEAHLPDGSKMAFSGEVAEQFEDQVISRQIPGYNKMRERNLHLTMEFLQGNTQYVDLGTSTGRTLRDTIGALAHDHDPRMATVNFLGLDYEQDMLDQAQELMNTTKSHPEVVENAERHQLRTILSNPDEVPDVKLKSHDLRRGLPSEVQNTSLITSVFTVQFVPVEFRPRLFQQIYDRLVPGGAFVWSEKVLGKSAVIDDLYSNLYYQDKKRNGIKESEIIKKRNILDSYQFPLTHASNMEQLAGAGFDVNRKVDLVWKDLQFQTIVAIK